MRESRWPKTAYTAVLAHLTEAGRLSAAPAATADPLIDAVRTRAAVGYASINPRRIA